MKHKFGRRFYSIFALFLTVLITIPWAVFADNVDVSGDVITTTAGTTVDFGSTVCASTSSITKSVILAIKDDGGSNSNNNYAASASVTVASEAVTGANAASFNVTVPSAANTIYLPANWGTNATKNKLSSDPGVAPTGKAGSVQSSVQFTPAAPGSFTASVNYTLTGLKSGSTSATIAKTVAVNFKATVVNCDTTPPALTLPGNTTVEATSASGAVVTFSATASDAVDGARPVICKVGTNTIPSSGSNFTYTFPLGQTKVDCSSSDTKSNAATSSFTMTVQDTTGPVISTPSNMMTAPAADASGATVGYTAPTANDAVDGPRPVTCTPVSGSKFALGQTTVTCSASDTRNNTSTKTFVIDVKDDQAPVLQLPGPITAEATSANGAVVTYSTSATDNVDGAVTATCSPASGSTFTIGTTTVSCAAKDAAGNTNGGSFFVTVQDTKAPELTVPHTSVTAEAAGANGVAVTYAASASDIVDGAVATSCSPASGSIFAIGTTTVTCSATDAHGTSASASFNVVVTDSKAPELNLPSDQSLEATGANGAIATYNVTANDLVDPAVVVSCVDQNNKPVASGEMFPIGTTTVTCSAKDAHNNLARASFMIKVVDKTLPSLHLPSAPIIAEATSAAGAAVSYDATADDVVDGAVAPVCVNQATNAAVQSSDTFSLGATTITCSAADTAGNTASGSFVITVQDTTEPTIANSLGTIDAAETSDGATVSYTTPGATDLVDGSADVSCSPASGSFFALGTTTVTCSATDKAGNKAVQSYTVDVQDLNAPVLSLPAPIVKEATSAAGAVITYQASADDVVSGLITPSCSPASGSTFLLGTTTVNCLAADPSGNKAQGSFSVTVQDNTKPDLKVPANITSEATGKDGAAVSYATTATDIVDGAVAVSCDFRSGTIFPLGETTVMCSAIDTAGNKAQDSFTITMQDTTEPSLILPANIPPTEATGPSGAAVDYTASAEDIVDGAMSPSCSVKSGATFPVGTTTVSCVASDAHGNTTQGSFNVTVTDTTPPSLKLPTRAIIEEATGADGAKVSYDATADDIVDGAILVVCDKPSGSTFALVMTTVNCSATDAHGNTAQDSFSVEVQDTTAPTINGQLVDIEAEAIGASGALISYTSPSAKDVVDGDRAVTCAPASDTTFALGTTTVTCSASDSRGNTASRDFSIKVQDTKAPVLVLPRDIIEEATGHDGATVTYQASANDIVDGDITPICNPASSSTFAIQKTTVGCSAADKQGNTANSSFSVTVQDTTPPVLTVPGKVVAEATGANGAQINYDAPSALDIVDGTIAASCNVLVGAIFGLGETTVTCSATDAHNNVATGSFTVEVVDRTAPVLAPPDDIIAEATGQTGAAVSYATPTATDLVDGNDAVTCGPASGTTFALGDTKVTCSATDAHGNGASINFTITVQDTTKPALTLPGNITAEATSAQGTAVSYEATADDIVDGSIAPYCDPASDTTFALGTTTVTCSATDIAGNQAQGNFTVTVRDTTAPEIIGSLSNSNAEATGATGALVTYSAPTAEDKVDGSVVVTCSPASGSIFGLGTTTVICSATDWAGNLGTKSYTIDVQDTTAPTLSLPNDIVAEATSALGRAVAYVASANDIVDGSVTLSCAPASGSTFALDATTTVSCSAADAQGNMNGGSFTVRVKDTTPPTLSGMPANITAEATSAAGSAVAFTAPAATDLVDGAVAVSCKVGGAAVKSGDTFPLGKTTVTCSATDTHGNTASGSFDVTVQDTIAPKLGLPADIAVVPTSATGVIVSYTASASDKVDGAISPKCAPASGSLFGLGMTMVTCSATDAHNNTSSGSFKVMVAFSSWSGVLQPINTNGSSIFNQGSTVPVKFQITGASAKITNAVVKLYYTKIGNNITGTEAEAISTSAANNGNMFRYDPTGNQYIFNLATKGLSVGTYQLRLDFGDGVRNTVNISLR
jgi:hypothetical protein